MAFTTDPPIIVPFHYNVLHGKCLKLRGPARDYECVDCDSKPSQWTMTHGFDGTDPWCYSPRCIGCHRRYDMVPHQQFIYQALKMGSPELSARISNSGTGRRNPHPGYPMSAETRAKLSATAMGNQNSLGNVISLDTRAKMSAGRKSTRLNSSH